MQSTWFLPLFALSLPFFTPSATTAPHRAPIREEGHELDVRDIAGQAKVTLRAAIATALSEQAGRAVEAGLECEVDDDERDFFYEVLVLTAGGELVEVHVDPVQGGVKSKADAEEDEDEIPGFAAALRHSELDLTTLVERAEAFVKGSPVAASLEFEDGGPECTVSFVNTRYVFDATLEARAGHLTELELKPEKIHDGREHGDEDGEGDRDGEGHEDDKHGEKGEKEEAGEAHGEHGGK